ncbi:cytidylate kinase-like family protein [Coprobacillus sp. AF09-1A]|nr:cytidylate kinase-like family protein [Coprobacillus sp. AF09-1A]
MRIITISREFGSGGRELGKRMADILGCAYYDKEIITAIAKDSHMDEKYIERLLSTSDFLAYPITIASTFSYPTFIQNHEVDLLLSRQRVIKHIATQGDCIIMGQGADSILSGCQPLNLFVYADMQAKLNRCKERAPKDENLTDQQLQNKILQVDEGRARQYEFISAKEWGEKGNYHLCINTTEMNIKDLAPLIAEYAELWFEVKKS